MAAGPTGTMAVDGPVAEDPEAAMRRGESEVGDREGEDTAMFGGEEDQGANGEGRPQGRGNWNAFDARKLYV